MNNNIIKKQSSQIVLDNRLNELKNKITDGIQKKEASTGTPLEKLHGASKITATISNVGGGSKETGETGIQGGMETIFEFFYLQGGQDALKNIQNNNSDMIK